MMRRVHFDHTFWHNFFIILLIHITQKFLHSSLPSHPHPHPVIPKRNGWVENSNFYTYRSKKAPNNTDDSVLPLCLLPFLLFKQKGSNFTLPKFPLLSNTGYTGSSRGWIWYHIAQCKVNWRWSYYLMIKYRHVQCCYMVCHHLSIHVNWPKSP